MLGQIAYYINTHFWIPNNLKDKYPVKKVSAQDKEDSSIKIDN
jgi:hypothetical protein